MDDENELGSTLTEPISSVGQRKLLNLSIDQLRPDPRNPRRHTRAQVRAIAKSIDTHGFNAPILVDRDWKVIAGHGRLEAAKMVGLTHVPVICLHHLSAAQARAYMLADNKLTDRSTWDDALLGLHLKELSVALDFDIETTGFEAPEIDLRIQLLDEPDAVERADEFEFVKAPAVSRIDDVWLLGDHRLICGSALEFRSYDLLLCGQVATASFSDPPFNVPIDENVCGKGSVKHREFEMASGEMSEAEFTSFLSDSLKLTASCLHPGALLYVCMDWRHLRELLDAGDSAEFELLNMCVWVKTNSGMGSLYRSRHELVFVFRKPGAPHLNNVQLGRFGRNRANVWNYPGANAFARKGREGELALHPTVKPVALVVDAILDSTKRGNIVLDPFLGSGTTVLAAERTGRRCYGIEIDPIYVDTAIERWQRMTRKDAQHASGATFAQLKAKRLS